MAEKIQRTPLGLLGLLGIKSLGKNPDQISDTVIGAINMAPFYWASKLEVHAELVTNVGATAGDAPLITVPDSEDWLVLGVGLDISTGQTVGDVNDLSCTLLPPRGVEGLTVVQHATQTINSVLDVTHFGKQLEFPIVLPGGSRIAWIFNQALTTDIGVEVIAMIVRLDAG